MLYTLPRSFRQFPSIAKSFVHGDGLPLQHVLSETRMQRIADEEGVSFGSTFTVSLVLWAFVTQVLSKDQTCLATINRIITVLVASGRAACSAHPGGYCKARAKLPESFLGRLAVETGQAVEDPSPAPAVASRVPSNADRNRTTSWPSHATRPAHGCYEAERRERNKINPRNGFGAWKCHSLPPPLYSSNPGTERTSF